MAETASGVFKRVSGNVGVLLDPDNSFRKTPNDIIVNTKFINTYKLVDGVSVVGQSEVQKSKMVLTGIKTICNLKPEKFLKRTPFQQLVAINPTDRFHIGQTEWPSLRIIELMAPIGKGTRGLIVSPPKAGKTLLLQQIAQSLYKRDPSCRIIVLLIDERPEEVTWFRRSVHAEVLSSSSDQSLQEHVDLSELTLAHIKAELECGRDVVVLLDSLTRMGRAFNLRGTKHGRTMSGGLDSRALEIPRRFFGLARNVDNGGSVTIIATALVDTNSRMDQMIFEEFKGTGNSEIVLDRTLADDRVIPALNINSCGTRREELLFTEEEYSKVSLLRRMLADLRPKEAMLNLLKLVDKYKTNDELLESFKTL
jgi:transcription termination factor Rho